MGTVRVTAVRTAKRTSSNMVSNLYTLVKVWSNSASTLSVTDRKQSRNISACAQNVSLFFCCLCWELTVSAYEYHCSYHKRWGSQTVPTACTWWAWLRWTGWTHSASFSGCDCGNNKYFDFYRWGHIPLKGSPTYLSRNCRRNLCIVLLKKALFANISL